MPKAQPESDDPKATDGNVDWLLDTRKKIISRVLANPSLAARAILVPPLSELPPETLARARDLMECGDQVQLVDLLIEAVREEAIRTMMRPDTPPMD